MKSVSCKMLGFSVLILVSILIYIQINESKNKAPIIPSSGKQMNTYEKLNLKYNDMNLVVDQSQPGSLGTRNQSAPSASYYNLKLGVENTDIMFTPFSNVMNNEPLKYGKQVNMSLYAQKLGYGSGYLYINPIKKGSSDRKALIYMKTPLSVNESSFWWIAADMYGNFEYNRPVRDGDEIYLAFSNLSFDIGESNGDNIIAVNDDNIFVEGRNMMINTSSKRPYFVLPYKFIVSSKK